MEYYNIIILRGVIFLDKPDIIIIGGGPAGLSAALTARSRGKVALVVTNSSATSGLFKAERVDNYPGLPGVTGARLIGTMRDHAEKAGAEFINARVLTASASKKGFFVTAGSELYEARAVIIATGITVRGIFPGEERLLGRGVSYCATCDGMLHRNKRAAVVGLADDAVHEANFLREIGCEVMFFSQKPAPEELREDITRYTAKKFEIKGEARVEALVADGEEYPADVVFVLRNTVSVASLMPGLNTDGGFITTDRSMATSVPGVFAAGDCTGAPYQIAKAVGEGNIAALSAAEYLDKNTFS